MLILASGLAASAARLVPEPCHGQNAPARFEDEHVGSARALLSVLSPAYPVGQDDALALTDLAAPLQTEPGMWRAETDAALNRVYFDRETTS